MIVLLRAELHSLLVEGASLVMDADARQELLEACDPMVRLQRTLGLKVHIEDKKGKELKPDPRHITELRLN